MKKFIVLFSVFSVWALSGDLFAAERKNWEICFAGGSSFSGAFDSAAFGAASLACYYKFIGAEVSGAIFDGDTVVGGNLVIALFRNQGFIANTTGGVWTTTDGGFGFSAGGGIKIMLSNMFAIRGEYRRYAVSDSNWEANAIFGGISLFF